MYRVELKEATPKQQIVENQGFLMYRVELKVHYQRLQKRLQEDVPNVPCGVESFLQQRFLFD